ncbi:hypothetical protein FHW67_001850 [Herbaspirillum sp. Sphag1AN]|uniref:YbcC family protein n=1 Tax=unclassified Herbaspirillum TaxID=2624150 RepID=UPI00160A3867|nr:MULTISPECIES: DUF2309 domain-containing protein [unclassified Herbaspirillum]MBB3212567.1 hypothetical protein [Herbaspirillum sp. Sphag1AN]MBB3245764.1 hypothetical protein [Herbaspirillum sp. Sphag64]
MILATSLDHAINDAINHACQRACSAIAPSWPLDRAIAVNPHWGRIDRPLHSVAARLALLGGVQVYPNRQQQRAAWLRGQITPADLQLAIAQCSGNSHHGHTVLTAQQCINALETVPDLPALPLLIDLLDQREPELTREHRLPWRQAITHQVSQTCAAYFDNHQADWRPQGNTGLYAFWRDTLLHDHGIGILMGLPDLGQRLAKLPATPAQAESWVLQRLGLPQSVWPDYLEALLLTINGWASWCAYLHWQAQQEGRATEDTHLRELLAIRLAWGAIVLPESATAATDAALRTLQDDWRNSHVRLAEAEAALAVDEVWQLALDISYQRQLAQRLIALPAAPSHKMQNPETPPRVQAVFCIDVRSEPLRRAMETCLPQLQTVGFAGFFGLPVSYTPLGSSATRPQLPGLLAPVTTTTDVLTPAAIVQGSTVASLAHVRQQRFAIGEQWHAAARWPASAVSFVEAFGLIYGSKLRHWLWARPQARRRQHLTGLKARERAQLQPALTALDTDSKVKLAAAMLRGMGLRQTIAPLVLLIGHGSQSKNNPQSAGLECGACCGQSGEVNARVAAHLLNQPEVRAGLALQGIDVPATSHFIAALHNTTTDELEWFDLEQLPANVATQLDALQSGFALALDQVRRERAPRLQLDPSQSARKLLLALQQRASDGAQTRPEWGLAGNAALVIGRRARSRGITLDGRSFLHDYDADNDPDGSLLELLMTAPMLVAHWINWQYHASTCDPLYYGSGNKLLHNVVGGRIGVFEGNGGDLRIGLSKQSLHDGIQWMHDPVRLTVVIEAPQERIDTVLSKHQGVRQLVEHGWLHLWQWQDGQLSSLRQGIWQGALH